MNAIFPRWSTANVLSGFSYRSIQQSFHRNANLSHLNFSRFFTIHVERSPPSSLLKKRIWAVHATSSPPVDGEITPYFNKTALGLNDQSIPNIANTIHWTLGELARSYLQHSWEHHSFAVLTPLGTIIDQTINIFAPNTITWGKWKLASSSIVVAPSIVNHSDLKKMGIKVVTYNKVNSSLRSVVDRVIRDEGGWPFRMPNQGWFLGTKALINGQRNINTPDFFHHLLKENPDTMSFGDEFHSQIGDAYLVGFIRELICKLCVSENEFESYVCHSLLKFYYHKAKNKYFPVAEQEKMEKFLNEKKSEISGSSILKTPLKLLLTADLFHAMTLKELHAFQEHHSDLFIQVNLHEFEGTWAACRWLVIGYEQGLKEKLNIAIDEAFKLCSQSDPETYSATILFILERHSKRAFSDRFHIFNAILNIKGVQDYLKRMDTSITTF